MLWKTRMEPSAKQRTKNWVGWGAVVCVGGTKVFPEKGLFELRSKAPG